MFPSWLRRHAQRSSTANRSTVLRVEVLEDRDLLAAHPFEVPFPPGNHAYDPLPVALTAGPGSGHDGLMPGPPLEGFANEGQFMLSGDRFTGGRRGPEHDPGIPLSIGGPNGPGLVLVEPTPAFGVWIVAPPVDRAPDPGARPDVLALVEPGASEILVPIVAPAVEGGGGAPVQPVQNAPLKAITPFSPTALATGVVSRQPVINGQTGGADAVRMVFGQPAAELQKVLATAVVVATAPAIVPNGDALRGVAAVLVGAGFSTANVPSERVIDGLFALRPMVPADAATGLPSCLAAMTGSLPGASILPTTPGATLPADASAATVYATELATPLLAELLKPAADAGVALPLLSLQQLVPVEGEHTLAAVLMRFVRSPYLPGAVATVLGLEVLRRHLRRGTRRAMATELPEITGPRGL